MSKRMLIVMAGVVMTSLAAGCCCHNKCNPCGPCGGYGAGYGASPCGPGGCAPTYGYPAGPTSYYQGPEATAFAPTTTVTSAPVFGAAYPTTAVLPMQSLPPY